MVPFVRQGSIRLSSIGYSSWKTLDDTGGFLDFKHRPILLHMLHLAATGDMIEQRTRQRWTRSFILITLPHTWALKGTSSTRSASLDLAVAWLGLHDGLRFICERLDSSRFAYLRGCGPPFSAGRSGKEANTSSNSRTASASSAAAPDGPQG